MMFDLWTFFVEQLFGGFWLSVLGIMVLIFIILAVFGKMSKMTVIFYEMLFAMTMTMGYGYKWISALIGIAIFMWAYNELSNAYR